MNRATEGGNLRGNASGSVFDASTIKIGAVSFYGEYVQAVLTDSSSPAVPIQLIENALRAGQGAFTDGLCIRLSLLRDRRMVATVSKPQSLKGGIRREKESRGVPTFQKGAMMRSVMFTLKGQMKSGKNLVQVTRTGQRYPKKGFKVWRDAMLKQIPKDAPFEGPVALTVDYVPGDLLRRDVPGILDALCHLLEKGGVLYDDAQVKNVNWHQWPLDREHPKCRVTIQELAMTEGKVAS